MSKKIYVITGPTASNKTQTAIQAAKKINCDIICADSRIVYKDLDIVSAKPTLIEQDGITHHLIDILTPEIEFSAGDFVKHAKKIIDEEFKKGKDIIISGGTWFYIKSLLDKDSLPDCKINKELREELNKLDKIELWEKLNKLDCARAQKIHPNNKDKVIRSIELCLELNMPVSEYQRKENKKYESFWYMMDFSREELYKRIDLRVDKMIESGLIEEWERNSKKYPNSTILKNTIGYKEFFDYKDGIYKTKNETIDKIKQHTRNFAKRQLTYFRQNKNIKLIQSADDIND